MKFLLCVRLPSRVPPPDCRVGDRLRQVDKSTSHIPGGWPFIVGSRGRDRPETVWESMCLLIGLLEVPLQLPMDGSHHLPRLFVRPEVNPDMSRTTAPAFLEPEQRSRTQRTLTPPRYHRPAPARATLQATLRRSRRAVLHHSLLPRESEPPPDLVAIVQDLESHILDEDLRSVQADSSPGDGGPHNPLRHRFTLFPHPRNLRCCLWNCRAFRAL